MAGYVNDFFLSTCPLFVARHDDVWHCVRLGQMSNVGRTVIRHLTAKNNKQQWFFTFYFKYIYINCQVNQQKCMRHRKWSQSPWQSEGTFKSRRLQLDKLLVISTTNTFQVSCSNLYSPHHRAMVGWTAQHLTINLARFRIFRRTSGDACTHCALACRVSES